MQQPRTKIHKTPLNEAEHARALRVATAFRKQLAPFVRDLIEQACIEYESILDAQVPRQINVMGMRINREGPRHGHFASLRRRLSLPSRVPGGGAPMPHLRV